MYSFILRAAQTRNSCFRNSPLSHAEQLMEQRATFIHAQSDTNEYTLLIETGAAEEVLLPDHRNNPRTVLCGASSLKVNIFWFRRVCCSRMWTERKYTACEVDWLLHALLNIRRLVGFFSYQSAKSLTFPPTILLSPASDIISDAQLRHPPLRYQQVSGLVFSSWTREGNSALGQLGHSCQFLFIISSTQLDVWNSQTLGENHVCLNFKNRLLAGNEYPATVAQLCRSESKTNPKGC